MTIKITQGIDEEAQESSFMNATLQGWGKVAFSISTTVKVPQSMQDDPEQVARWVESALNPFDSGVVDFEVQIGESRSS